MSTLKPQMTRAINYYSIYPKLYDVLTISHVLKNIINLEREILGVVLQNCP